jgi:uncharacterized protein
MNWRTSVRKTSSWLDPRLEVRPSQIHGLGVFTRSTIAIGERIAIFGGMVMRIDEIDNLPEHLQEFPMQIEERFVLGCNESEEPEPSDYFNHSCKPNCGFRGQIFLVAMRDIAPEEELTFDYAMVVSKSVGSQIIFEMECSCNFPECRRNITEEDWMLPDLQDRYNGFFSQYLTEKILAQGVSRETSK